MDFPRPANRRQALAWWIADNAATIALILAAAPILVPAMLYLGAAMYEQATAPEQYPFTGFCPDCPAHYDTPACHE